MIDKHTALAAIAALACTTALAQAPVSQNTRPPSEVAPAASGGPAAARAQNKVDDRSARSTAAPADAAAAPGGRTAPVAEIDPTRSGGKAAAKAETRVNVRLMDTNGDGMVSRSEWDAYHTSAWDGMKPSASGVSTADIDRMNRMHSN